VYAETVSSDASQVVSGNTHSQFLGTRVVDETKAVSRAPLQSCGNTHYDVFSSPEFPVLSSIAQQCLRSGLQHK